jgi:hypothetical protein
MSATWKKYKMRNQAIANQQSQYLLSNENVKLDQLVKFNNSIAVNLPPNAPVFIPPSDPNLPRKTIISNTVLSAIKSVTGGDSPENKARALLYKYTKEEIKVALDDWLKIFEEFLRDAEKSEMGKSLIKPVQKSKIAATAILKYIEN